MSNKDGFRLSFNDQKDLAGLASDKRYSEFGMVYEKFVFANIIQKLIQGHALKTVCEYPANDLMGNNSEEFEKYGCHVTRLTTPNGTDKKYDLVWNFCEFEKSENPYGFVQDILNLSKKYALIVTQNKFNVLVFHRLYHFSRGKKWDHGFVKYMSARTVAKILNDMDGVEIVEVGAFDVPWFVLDFYEGGSAFRRIVPKSLLSTKTMKESAFEKLPLTIRTLFAHHNYVFCEKVLK